MAVYHAIELLTDMEKTKKPMSVSFNGEIIETGTVAIDLKNCFIKIVVNAQGDRNLFFPFSSIRYFQGNVIYLK